MTWRAGVQRAAASIAAGGVVAYPTEAVYGLGCDPLDMHAVARILDLKQRPVTAGFILLAAERSQLDPYLAELSPDVEARLEGAWPGPVTFVLPAVPGLPDWLTGGRDTVAARVTSHAIAAALCRSAGMAIVSTSANRSGHPPARSSLQVRRRFPAGLDYVLGGRTGTLAGPTEIRDGLTGAVLRPAA